MTHIYFNTFIIKINMSWSTIQIDDTLLRVNYEGELKRKMKSGNWKTVENICNHINGMNVFVVNKRQYTRSKIMGCLYYNLDINKKYICKFKDNDRLNCNINNLRFISI